MKHILALATALLILAADGTAQPDTLWTRTYGASMWDYAYAALQLADGGFVIAGGTMSPAISTLVKTDAAGNRQWLHTLGVENASVNDVQQTADGGFMLAGISGSINATIAKADTGGGQQWTQNYSHNFANFVSLAKCPNGDFIAAGHETYGTQAAAYYVKFDAQGNNIWQRTYWGPDSPAIGLTLDAVCATADGGFVGVGTADTVDAVIDEDFFVMRVSPAGDTLWTRVIDGAERQNARSIQSTPDGYVIGGLDNLGSVFYPHILKIDGNGNVIWNRVITTLGSAGCVGAFEIESGDLILGGTVYNGAPSSPDFYVARVAPNDSVLWLKRVGGSATEWAEDMKLTADGGCIITGRTNSFGVLGWDFYAVRTTPVHVIAAVDAHAEFPELLTLTSYPNPFNTTARIEFTLARSERATLRIFDVLGREVRVLADGVMAPGPHIISFDGSALASGVYFARLESADAVKTQKMLLLK